MNSGHLVTGHGYVNIIFSQKFNELAAIPTTEGDDVHSGLSGCSNGMQKTVAIASAADD